MGLEMCNFESPPSGNTVRKTLRFSALVLELDVRQQCIQEERRRSSPNRNERVGGRERARCGGASGGVT